jgi:hypothetical protein
MSNTASSALDAEGTTANAEEAITVQTEIGDGYLQVADASKFAEGDWISVFDDTNHAWNNRDDEGFIVQSIDSTASPERIYFRRRISRQFTLQNDVEKALNDDDEKGNLSNLKRQMLSFQKMLISDIDNKSFSDLYAQTIAYGMFAARYHDPTIPTFSREEAATLIPHSNPFLRKLSCLSTMVMIRI